MSAGIHPLAQSRFIAPDDPRLVGLPKPVYGPGYLAKFGPVSDADVFWVSDKTSGATAGMRVHGSPERVRANVVAMFLEFEADIAELRRAAEVRRLEYEHSPSATCAGGVAAEMEALDARHA